MTIKCAAFNKQKYENRFPKTGLWRTHATHRNNLQSVFLLDDYNGKHLKLFYFNMQRKL